MPGDGPAAGPPQDYVRALRFAALTRFYDALVRLALPEDELRRRLVEQANILPGHAVLDLGCGTGSLTIRIKQTCPAATVVGLDGDAEILARASRKAEEAGVSIDFRPGLADAPPFADGSFDRIVSSLMFHHLTTAQTRSALTHSRRLLRPGGQIHIADWGRPANLAWGIAFLSVRLLDGFATTADSAHGRQPALLRDAGFVDVGETGSRNSAFGTLRFFRGNA